MGLTNGSSAVAIRTAYTFLRTSCFVYEKTLTIANYDVCVVLLVESFVDLAEMIA